MSKSAGVAAAKRINFVLFDTFKKIHGDMNIPRRFVIPSEPAWPVESHGLKLGNYVDRIRESVADKTKKYDGSDIKRLVDKGFIVNQHEYESQEVLKTFELYKKKFNSTDIPVEFRVPSTAPWPKTQWDESLNGIIKQMKHKRVLHKSVREQLSSLGFDVSIVAPAQYSFEQLHAALAAYKKTHRNLLVPFKFTIPVDDVRYPEDTWGMQLGKELDEVRNNNAHAEHREALVELGLSLDEVVRPKFKEVHLALKVFQQANEHVNVPQSFQISTEDTLYPESVRGMKLGHILHSIRTQGVFNEHRQVLEDLGIDFDSVKKYPFEVKFLALETYKKVYGHLRVPFAYVIPELDVQFPEECRGLKLGSEVKKIRRGYHAVHKDKLLAIGFEYKIGESRDAKKEVNTNSTQQR